MNKVILCGRLTKDPDVHTNGDSKNARYTIAVDRPYKKDGGQDSDFVSCVVFGKSADFAEKYLQKGIKILIEGRIQTGSYTNKEGQKVYTTDVVVDRHEFVESKGQRTGQTSAPPPMQTAPQYNAPPVQPQYQAQAPQMPPQQQQYQAPPQQYQQPYQQQYQQQIPPQYQQQAPQQVTGQEQWMQIPQDGAGEELPFI